ncbi:MAG: protocatechuate 3,4-dioxygenase [Acidobacteriia bacterium]|nr:protocatechuate 3,4-dioxygenase [Terriglobia bacterium]MBV8903718.1 protocatechuate 3,4-dioxygenase [Terriglobia bacterium]
MAEIVLGVGSAHGPLLSTPPEKWDLRAKADRENKSHWYRGRTYDYESLLRERAPGFAEEVAIETRRERHARCRTALEALSRKVKEAAPEALVIVGNDQREYFGEDLTPAITVYRGAEIYNARETHEPAPGLNIAEPGNAPETGTSYPGAPALADHILERLSDEGFDPAQSNSRPKGATRPGIPHAYGFVYHTILDDAPPPSVPIILNVHFPHNQPKASRCLALGRALQKAIRSFQGCGRVAVVASGGLTHFVVDEEFDREVLRAMDRADENALASLPEDMFKVGTAEIKNWLPVAAAMDAEGRRCHQVDYVPCYRSEAGTGNAMGFVYWE